LLNNGKRLPGIGIAPNSTDPRHDLATAKCKVEFTSPGYSQASLP
jgi:hypothetical protein